MATTKKRQLGSTVTPPNYDLRVRVSADQDPVTKRRHFLTEIIPAGPKAQAQAEKARTRLLNQVDERHNPRTSATVNQLLDKHFEFDRSEPDRPSRAATAGAPDPRPPSADEAAAGPVRGGPATATALVTRIGQSSR